MWAVTLKPSGGNKPGLPLYTPVGTVRVLLILALLWQPLLLGALGSGLRGDERASFASCLPTDIQNDCCEPVSNASTCHVVVTSCGCAIRPSDVPQPAPDAPLPRPDRDTLVTIQICGPPPVMVAGSDYESSLSAHTTSACFSNKTHNEVQTILDIWRT